MPHNERALPKRPSIDSGRHTIHPSIIEKDQREREERQREQDRPYAPPPEPIGPPREDPRDRDRRRERDDERDSPEEKGRGVIIIDPDEESDNTFRL